MPKGVPVATVAIDGAVNAALLAIQILAVYDEELSTKLLDKKSKMTNEILEKDKVLQSKL
jgi:5-(carboxyamino)imidazole ribonucleotide mutase